MLLLIEVDIKFHILGNLFSDLRREEDAINDYTKAIEIDPKYADAYNNRGTFFFNFF